MPALLRLDAKTAFQLPLGELLHKKSTRLHSCVTAVCSRQSRRRFWSDTASLPFVGTSCEIPKQVINNYAGCLQGAHWPRPASGGSQIHVADTEQKQSLWRQELRRAGVCLTHTTELIFRN